MTLRSAGLVLLAMAAACGGEAPAPAADGATAGGAFVPAREAGWRSAPVEGVSVRPTDGGIVASVVPHAVIWPAEAERLTPPYAVDATLHKRSGRLHEGYGLVFGGDPLDGLEAEQAYSYFLIRGDGSYLIRRREGAELPILVSWTSAAAIRRDTEEGGQPNRLRVEVGDAETVFLVNGDEVARLPTAELRTEGVAGVRIAHDVDLEVTDFHASSSRSGGPRE